jgi:cellulose synthase/poly-beta-1,6-N-acetylglucosamine synthase-like glycosyltransferase
MSFEVLYSINGVISLVFIFYILRQYLFSIVTLRNKDLDNFTDYIPNRTVSILIPARNEERVIDQTLEFMSKLDYPLDKMEILVLNDASTDGTSKIAHEWADRYPFIRIVDRKIGGLGKGDALNQGLRESKNDIILVFDADYTPAPDTVKKLVRWFEDPKIGLVQGRIYVVNKDTNILTKMINTERCAGFLCDLFARDKLKISNQYGGTAGGFRRELISKVGEWDVNTYCEDTDLTCRALIAGYKIKYDVSVNCGEEAPDSLKAYYKQRYRWIRGHTICGLKYTQGLLTSPFLSMREKIDSFFWININLIPILIIIGQILGVTQYFLSPVVQTPQPYSMAMIFISGGATVAMVFASLYQIKQMRYLKFAILMVLNSFIMSFIISIKVYLDILFNSPFKWNKTERSIIIRSTTHP